MPVKVAINGFGRIGRNVFKCILDDNQCASLLEVVAVNDLTDPKTLAHLFKYDSVQGINSADIENTTDGFTVNGKMVRILAERNPSALPWKELGVSIVVESTGIFTKRADAEKHLKAGAKKVVVSAPATDPDVTLVLGVNEKTYNNKSADDLSYRWLLSTVVGLILVNMYAINFDLWSLYIPGVVELFFVFILICFECFVFVFWLR